MKSWRVIISTAIFCLFASFAPGLPAAPSPAEIENISQAMPVDPAAKPASSRRLLVFTLCKGYVHSSIPYAAKALELMGEKTGAFTVQISNDMKVFRPDTLNQFDAVCFNNTTDLTFDEEPHLRESLMQFIKSGKGIVGLHAATDNFKTWDQAAQMMGGVFDGHPWTADGTWAFRVEDPASPLNAAFSNLKFDARDEIYRTRMYDLRKNCRVLIGLDLADKTTATADGVRQTDVDIPVTWIRSFGEGRVFHFGFGHNHHIYWDAELMQHLLAGVQFALGDLEADTTPVPFDPAANVNFEQLDAILSQIAGYEYGQSRAAIYQLQTFLADLPKAAPVSDAVVKRLSAFLKSDATVAAKKKICEELSIHGSPAAAKIMADLLTDEQLGDMARFALERIPGVSVDELLIAGLDQVEGDKLIGLINTIGRREIEDALSLLARQLQSSDEQVQIAASIAIGRLGTRDALTQLEKYDEQVVSGRTQEAFAAALLECADRLAKRGEKDLAVSAYRRVLRSQLPYPLRAAGLSGLIEAAPKYGVEKMMDILRGNDAAMKSAAIGLVRQTDDAELAAALAEQLSNLNSNLKVQLMGAMADMNQPAAANAVVLAASSSNEDVAVAAITALSSLGSAENVPMLATATATRSRRVQQAALQTLSTMQADGVDAAIVRALSLDDLLPAAKIALIQTVDQRRIDSAGHQLLELAKSSDRDIATAALGAMQNVGSGGYDQLVALMLQASDRRVSRAAGRTILARAQNAPNSQSMAVEALAEALNKTSDPRIAASLIAIMGRIGSDAALPYLEESLNSPNPQIVNTAVSAISRWPNTVPADSLLNLAKNKDNQKTQILAVRGYIQLADKADTEKAVNMLSTAIEIAQRPAEKKTALSVLTRFPSERSLQVAESLQQNQEVADEAKVAADSIRHALVNTQLKAEASRNSDNAFKALDRDPATRWDTAGHMQPGDWFIIDMGSLLTVKNIILDSAGSANDYPRGWELYISKDKQQWSGPVGSGDTGSTVTEIKPTAARPARYIKIVQTGSSNEYYWSIHEVHVNFY